MTMKINPFHFLIVFVVMFAAQSVSAQNIPVQEVFVPEGYELVDTVIYRPVAAVDTAFVGKNILDLMPKKSEGASADVNVRQSEDVTFSMQNYRQANLDRSISGYRVRIFFDNKQSARLESEETLKQFETKYHDVRAYHSYVNPYFKVTVGDFRTKSEAMELLNRIKKDFPSAFVVKENIEYPVVDETNAVVADTIKVLRPKAAK